MRLRIQIMFAGFTAFATLAQGQAKAAKPEIVNLKLFREATLVFQIQSSNNDVVIPYCEKDAEGNYLICAIGVAMVERFNGKSWSKVRPGYQGEVFGAEDSQMNPVVISKGSSVQFRFEFNPDNYHVRSGERLRLIVNYWNSVDSLKKGGAAGTIVGSTFRCP